MVSREGQAYDGVLLIKPDFKWLVLGFLPGICLSILL